MFEQWFERVKACAEDLPSRADPARTSLGLETVEPQ